MLDTSTFSFSYNVFHSYTSFVHQNAALCGNGLKKYFFGRSCMYSFLLSKYSDDEFKSMCDLLNQKFKNSEPHGNDQVWEKEQACTAFYEKDQQWHRVTVLTVEPTKIQVQWKPVRTNFIRTLSSL